MVEWPSTNDELKHNLIIKNQLNGHLSWWISGFLSSKKKINNWWKSTNSLWSLQSQTAQKRVPNWAQNWHGNHTRNDLRPWANLCFPFTQIPFRFMQLTSQMSIDSLENQTMSLQFLAFFAIHFHHFHCQDHFFVGQDKGTQIACPKKHRSFLRSSVLNPKSWI